MTAFEMFHPIQKFANLTVQQQTPAPSGLSYHSNPTVPPPPPAQQGNGQVTQNNSLMKTPQATKQTDTGIAQIQAAPGLLKLSAMVAGPMRTYPYPDATRRFKQAPKSKNQNNSTPVQKPVQAEQSQAQQADPSANKVNVFQGSPYQQPFTDSYRWNQTPYNQPQR